MKINSDSVFADFVTTEKLSGKRNYSQREYKIRELFAPIFFCLLALILVGKLFWVQIVNGSYYKEIADTNRTKTIPIHAPRGVILDRNNKPLVYNTPGFYQLVNGKIEIFSQEDALEKIADGNKDLEVAALRSYPYNEFFSHILGYIGQISPEELKTKQYSDYLANDLVGKIGIEKEYEAVLKGEDGKQLVEVDNIGNNVRTLGQTDPISGQDIKTNLDLEIQKSAFEASKNVKRGSVIVSTPKGEILAMISRPSFDPNFFTLGESYKPSTSSGYRRLSAILSDSENQPLLNRAISGIYPPGSTFKLITSVAGLENKIIDGSYVVEDTGVINVGEFSFSNWYFTQYGRTDGEVDVIKGIKRSNDIFFYKLSEKIGIDKISETAFNFGLGKKLGIDIPEEEDGLVPTRKWKQEAIGEPWYLGDTYHYGIGQGYLLTTPLQVNTWTEVIANGGSLYRPRIIKGSQKPVREGLVSEESMDLIRRGMIESCAPTGVAWPFFDLSVNNPRLKIDDKNYSEAPKSTTSAGFKDYRKISVACKTGTAQHGGEETMPHAWITLFAPAYDPEIVVTVLVEESGEGSNVAAPIAKKVVEEYFLRR